MHPVGTNSKRKHSRWFERHHRPRNKNLAIILCPTWRCAVPLPPCILTNPPFYVDPHRFRSAPQLLKTTRAPLATCTPQPLRGLPLPLNPSSSWTANLSSLVVNVDRGLSTYLLLLYSLYAVRAFHQMAVNQLSHRLSRTSDEKDPIDEKDNITGAYDVEGQGQPTGPRRGNRIDGPASGDAASGSSIEALIAAEANNAIKYRTCSWQKVNLDLHE